jgi:hypothetical protein
MKTLTLGIIALLGIVVLAIGCSGDIEVHDQDYNRSRLFIQFPSAKIVSQHSAIIADVEIDHKIRRIYFKANAFGGDTILCLEGCK